MDRDREKRIAAEAAAALVEDGMRVGLGTGSTVAHLASGSRAAARSQLRCVATIPGDRARRRASSASRSSRLLRALPQAAQPAPERTDRRAPRRRRSTAGTRTAQARWSSRSDELERERAGNGEEEVEVDERAAATKKSLWTTWPPTRPGNVASGMSAASITSITSVPRLAGSTSFPATATAYAVRIGSAPMPALRIGDAEDRERRDSGEQRIERLQEEPERDVLEVDRRERVPQRREPALDVDAEEVEDGDQRAPRPRTTAIVARERAWSILDPEAEAAEERVLVVPEAAVRRELAERRARCRRRGRRSPAGARR